MIRSRSVHFAASVFVVQAFACLATPLGAGASTFQKGLFTQAIDHSDPGTGSFSQRYLLSREFSAGKGDAPVLFVISGEEPLSPPSAAIAEAARKLGANIVSLEHRFYGKSQPFSGPHGLSTEHLRYLNMDSALEDLASFQRYAQDPRGLGLTGKWIVAGGSYAGTLSAIYRVRHPELVVGALDSSGFGRFDLVWQGYDESLADDVGPEAAADSQKMYEQLESILADPQQAALFRKEFPALASVDADALVKGLSMVVEFLVRFPYFLDVRTILLREDRLATMLKALGPVANGGLFGPGDFSKDLSDENPDDYVIGGRAWAWQEATELGMYAVPSKDRTRSLLSDKIRLSDSLALNRRAFGLYSPPDTARAKRRFYEPLLDSRKATHILVTYGARDVPEFGTDGEGVINPSLTVMETDGGHCADLSDPNASPSIRAARERFVSLARKWLWTETD